MSIAEEAATIREKLKKDDSIKVSIALFGQPGSGKSSLINKIIGKKVAKEGVVTDTTTEQAMYEHNGLQFVDLPGYDTKRFPRETFFRNFNIESFDLFLCIFSGKLHDADCQFFNELDKIGKVCIFVRNKHDELWQEGKTTEELEKEIENDLYKQINKKAKLIFTSCRKSTGFDELNKEIGINLDPAKHERWYSGAKAYSQEFLARKKEASAVYVHLSAASSAANGFNPILGLDMAIDVGIIQALFLKIRDNYGLDFEKLALIKASGLTALTPVINNIIQYASKEGILALFKEFASRQVAKQVAKVIPFVGPIIAGTISYGVTVLVGNNYVDECHQVASEILERELRK